MSMRVVLDVFSGRPNPSWSLTSEQQRELTERLEDLDPCAEQPEPPGLGYRGFELSAPAAADGGQVRLRVFERTVVRVEGDRTTCYHDDKGIEEWLIEQAHELGHAVPIPPFSGEPP